MVAIDPTTYNVAGIAGFQGAFLAGLAVSPDGSRVYLNALDFDGSLISGLVAIDAKSLKVTAVNPVQGTDVAVTPDGKYLFVPVLGTAGNPQGNVIVIRTAANRVVATLPFQADLSPGFVGITPDGKQVWVGASPLTNSAVHSIVVISTSNLRMTTSPFPPNAGLGRVLFSPDSSTAYVVAGTAAVKSR